MSKKSFVIFSLTFVTVSFGVAAMAALIPSIASNFRVEGSVAAKLIWMYMLPYGVFALFWSPLTSILSTRKIFLFITIGFCLSSFLFSLSTTIQQAMIFRFLMGAFGCGFVPLILISIGKSVPKEQRTKRIGAFFALSYISTSLSVFLSGFLSWRIIYAIPGIASFVIFVLTLFYLEDFDFRKEKFQISYPETFKDKKAVKFFIAVILGSFLYHSLQQWFGIYLYKNFSLPQITISLIFTISTFTAMTFEFIGGHLGSKYGNIKISKIGFMLMSVFVILLVITRGYKPLFYFVPLWGAGWALTHVGLCAHITHLPDRLLRDASSLNSALRFSFGGVGAFFGGMMISQFSFKGHFLIIGVSLFLLGFYLNKLIPKDKESSIC